MSDKGLLSKIYKELLKLSHKKINTLIKILAKDIYQTLYQGNYMDGKYAHERILHFICYQGNEN